MDGTEELRTCVSAVHIPSDKTGIFKIYWNKGNPSIGTEEELAKTINFTRFDCMWASKFIDALESAIGDCKNEPRIIVKLPGGVEIFCKITQRYGSYSQSKSVQQTLFDGENAPEVRIIAGDEESVVEGDICVHL